MSEELCGSTTIRCLGTWGSYSEVGANMLSIGTLGTFNNIACWVQSTTPNRKRKYIFNYSRYITIKKEKQ